MSRSIELILSILVFALVLLGGWLLNRDDGTLATTGKLSNRSKEQLYSVVAHAPHVVGAYVVKAKFTRSENPVLWIGSDRKEFIKLISWFLTTGAGSGLGAENLRNKDSRLIVEAVTTGRIVCDRIENSTLPGIVPQIVQHVRTICFGPLPPLDLDFKQVIVVLLDLPVESIDVLAIRKEILRVQLDVYHREYLNTEIVVLKK